MMNSKKIREFAGLPNLIAQPINISARPKYIGLRLMRYSPPVTSLDALLEEKESCFHDKIRVNDYLHLGIAPEVSFNKQVRKYFGPF